MDFVFSEINWMAAIPLGAISLFFLWLGFRRGVRFSDHENDSCPKRRLFNIFLLAFNLTTFAFCILIAICPIESWLVLVPFGLTMFIIVIPISILGSYYSLYFVSGYMPKNSGIKIQFLVQNEKPDNTLAWYEFSPFAFMAGWLIYFLVHVTIYAISWFTGKTQEWFYFGISVGLFIGFIAGTLLILSMFIKSRET